MTVSHDLAATASSWPLVVTALLLTTWSMMTSSAAAAACVGDCNGDRAVAVNELVTGVNIALGAAALDTCPALQCRDGQPIGIDCIVQAVNSALDGCPPSVPAPQLEGPITRPGTPFVAGTSFDPALVGYVQREYFVSGTARSFRPLGSLGQDGRWDVAPADAAAYKTRVVVYQPEDPARFNGSVVLEWLNVSGGLDASPDWTYLHTELIREGYAWAGVSAQRLGIEGGTAAVGVVNLPLKIVDPVRYASLTHPGDSFSYDIFSQVGQALRQPAAGNPLGDLAVQRVIAAGQSQSAFRMVTYANAVHPLARVFDGFLVHSRGGIGAPLSEAPQMAVAVPGTAAVRDDLDAPTLILQTESDLTFLQYAAARQPDSGRIRLWEVAGTAHADAYLLVGGRTDLGDSVEPYTLVVTSEPIPGFVSCSVPINSGPQHVVAKAALAALERWVRDGTPPPTAPRLDLEAGPPVALRRDARGNALGGIRTADVDVPIATLSGDPQGDSILCSLFGSTVPFDAATLTALYGSSAAYVAAVTQATDAAVAAGFVLPADAVRIKDAAALVEITP